MRILGKVWPDVVARRTWDGDGRPAWEFRITSRRTPVKPLSPAPAIESMEHPGDSSGQMGDDDRARLTHAGVVTTRGVQIGADTLRIDEFHYRIGQLDIDFGELLDGPDIAVALLELATDPGSEILRDRVASRLAVIRGWFQNAPSLEVSAARIAGSGIGRLLDGVFIWRAHDQRDTMTYIVTPSLQARDLLKADPGLARALIQVACPRPDDAQGDLERRLQEAIGRLNAAAEPGLGAVALASNSGVVLEVRSSDGPVSVSAAAPAADPGQGQARGQGQGQHNKPVGRTDLERSDSERALSEELAELARKVGTAAARTAPAPRPAMIDLDASTRRPFAEPFLQTGRPGGGTQDGRDQ